MIKKLQPAILALEANSVDRSIQFVLFSPIIGF